MRDLPAWSCFQVGCQLLHRCVINPPRTARPPLGHLRCVDAHIVRSQGYLNGAPVRTASTTSWMAWVTAAVCAGLSTRESWVEPGTTRCTLSVDRAADWFWSAIHPLLLPRAAVSTTRGFPLRL